MITIALFSSNNFFSKIIQWFEGSPIGHSAIGFEKDGQHFFLHAAWGGVQITPRETLLATHTLYAEFQILPDLGDELALAEKRIGQGYDVLTLFGYIFVLLGRKLHIGINNPFYSKSAEVCSEFVIELDSEHKIPEFQGLYPANIDPKDLFDICQKGSSFRRII